MPELLVLRIVLPVCLVLSLSACVASTAYHVATLPVRATSKVVDWTTTSRSEADRNAGRRMRKQQARAARDARRDARRERRIAQRQQPEG